MPRHAQQKNRTVYRSASADRAYRSGSVSRTIDMSQSPAYTVRQRATATATRYGIALGMIAATVWIFDLSEVINH